MGAMSRRAWIVSALGVVAFAGVTTAVGVASGAPLEFLALDLVTGLTFVAAGIVAAWLRPGSPTGPLLLASGALWWVGSYAPSGQPVVTHLGFAFERYYDLALAVLLLILSSPRQRLEPRPLIVVLAGAMAVRSLGRLLLQDPVRIYDCPDCPPNPLALWPDRVAFETVEIVSNAAVAGLVAIVALVVLRRLATAGPVLRRARWPILVAGGVALAVAALDAFEYAWSTVTGSLLVELPEPWSGVLDWSMFGARTLVPLGFLAATLRLRTEAGALGPLAADLGRRGGAGTVRDSLRTALGDPSLDLLRMSGGGWRTEAGEPAALPEAADVRAVTFVGPADTPLAALVHEPALIERRELLDAVVRVLGLALEKERLEAEVRDQLQEVTESRTRIVAAAEAERRRLERDLHDGAQQRLVGIMLALQHARASANGTNLPAELSRRLDAAADEINEAIRELRELARGIHPAILEEDGLGAAVAGLARRAGLPVETSVELEGRPPRLVESTAYFTIAEALTNAQRHAGATAAEVRVRNVGDSLEVEIRDDGAGGADPARGSGLRGLTDRVTALGGSLAVESPPGAGTVVRARIPMP